MKATKLREMSPEELVSEEHELIRQMFQLRLQKTIGQLEDVNKIRRVRKDLARLKTILAEKAGGHGN